MVCKNYNLASKEKGVLKKSKHSMILSLPHFSSVNTIHFTTLLTMQISYVLKVFQSIWTACQTQHKTGSRKKTVHITHHSQSVKKPSITFSGRAKLKVQYLSVTADLLQTLTLLLYTHSSCP